MTVKITAEKVKADYELAYRALYGSDRFIEVEVRGGWYRIHTHGRGSSPYRKKQVIEFTKTLKKRLAEKEQL